MLEWTSPLLLLLLVALPALRWLHRRRGAQRELSVPALFVWQGSVHDASDEPARARPDPIWLLRAALAAMLVVALADPLLVGGRGPRIDVFVDDADSLATREANGTRLTAAAHSLEARLAEANPSAVRLVSLRGRIPPLDLNLYEEVSAAVEAWGAQALGAEQAAALAPISRDGRRRWLATDGADEAVHDWARTAMPERVIQLGSATENAGVAHLGLRRSLDDPERLLGSARVVNAGASPTERTLEILAGERTVETHPLRLAAGEAARVDFSLDGLAHGRVTARLTPGDALASDDALSATAEPGAPTRIGAACAEVVRLALRAHPGIAVWEGPSPSRPALAVECRREAPDEDGVATLWLRPSTPGETPNATLVVEQVGGSRLVRLDLNDRDDRDSVRTPAFAAQLARALDLTAGRALLAPPAKKGRPESGISIAPRSVRASASALVVAGEREPKDLAAWPALLAGVMLGFDAWRTRRSR